ncbi:hypothetical protein NLG97_g5060 [Lecanicillium saksenae]|uniref:Uncharacterized protein n=1 Tax=Lecanicillium saksenae TaxID=468837 RepID=A0ACC1QUQ3_9HYPO|nr:hypothetical protein NLG97_g5060 [Lecanicillium saksenae]
MSPTLAVRPMHPPAFETIPELSPVLEYTSGGANKTNNYNYLSSSSFNRGTSASSSSSLHPQLLLQQQATQPTVEYTPLGRVIPKRPSTAPSPSTSVTRSQLPPQLPPINTALPPLAAYPMYPGLQTPPPSSSSSSHSSSGSTSSMSSSTTTVSSASSMSSTSTVATTTASRRSPEKPLNRPRKISTAHARHGSSASTASARSSYESTKQQGSPI